MESVHHLFDTGGVVPPMDIEDVDVASSQPLQRGLEGEVQRLGVVASVVGLLANWSSAYPVGTVLQRGMT